jgi:hypothetical protein
MSAAATIASPTMSLTDALAGTRGVAGEDLGLQQRFGTDGPSARLAAGQEPSRSPAGVLA